MGGPSLCPTIELGMADVCLASRACWRTKTGLRLSFRRRKSALRRSTHFLCQRHSARKLTRPTLGLSAFTISPSENESQATTCSLTSIYPRDETWLKAGRFLHPNFVGHARRGRALLAVALLIASDQQRDMAVQVRELWLQVASRFPICSHNSCVCAAMLGLVWLGLAWPLGGLIDLAAGQETKKIIHIDYCCEGCFHYASRYGKCRGGLTNREGRQLPRAAEFYGRPICGRPQINWLYFHI